MRAPIGRSAYYHLCMHVAAPMVPTADTRPRARGWLHLIAFLLTPALAAIMVTLAAFESANAVIGASVYCGSMMAMFGTSALYHRRRWTPRGWQTMRRLDHAMIFIFIAGTYTPLGLVALTGATRWWLLGTVWTACAAGIALKIGNPHGARWLAVPIYLTVGWGAVVVLGDLLTAAGAASVTLLVIGGMLYTIGGIAYATHRPNPRPGVFGYHEVFHLLTILAAACQYVAVLIALLGAPAS